MGGQVSGKRRIPKRGRNKAEESNNYWRGGGLVSLNCDGENGRVGIGKEGIWKWGRLFRYVSKSLPLPSKSLPPNLKTFLISFPWIWQRFQIPGGGNLKMGGRGGIWKRCLNSPRKSENVFNFLGGNLKTFSNSRGGFGRGEFQNVTPGNTSRPNASATAVTILYCYWGLVDFHWKGIRFNQHTCTYVCRYTGVYQTYYQP